MIVPISLNGFQGVDLVPAIVSAVVHPPAHDADNIVAPTPVIEPGPWKSIDP